ncbi:hypothetical protein EDC01DRAFT_453970 [Geopyxis carbonaria]|nr:hypothetical protein EDC01DRAFT_453970 [Geopyxis carbonaria]
MVKLRARAAAYGAGAGAPGGFKGGMMYLGVSQFCVRLNHFIRPSGERAPPELLPVAVTPPPRHLPALVSSKHIRKAAQHSTPASTHTSHSSANPASGLSERHVVVSHSPSLVRNRHRRQRFVTFPTPARTGSKKTSATQPRHDMQANRWWLQKIPGDGSQADVAMQPRAEGILRNKSRTQASRSGLYHRRSSQPSQALTRSSRQKPCRTLPSLSSLHVVST